MATSLAATHAGVQTRTAGHGITSGFSWPTSLKKGSRSRRGTRKAGYLAIRLLPRAQSPYDAQPTRSIGPLAGSAHGTLAAALPGFGRMTNGLTSGSLVAIASRPSMGKSLLLLQIANQIAQIDRHAVVFIHAQDDSESVAPTITERMASVESGIWPWTFRRIAGSRTKASHLALTRISSLPILLYGSTRLTVSEIASRATRFAAERSVPLGVIVVDDFDAVIQSSSPAESKLVVRGLRSIAKALRVPIVVTVPVNRAVERRRDHRPHITDFNEPYAAVVRAADMVITIYRDEVYYENSPDTGLAELAVFKRPFYRAATVKARFSEGGFRDSSNGRVPSALRMLAVR